MEKSFTHSPHTLISLLALVTALTVIIVAHPADGQTSSACSGAMISSFGSCVGFLTSGSNLSRPSSDCCNSLRDLMSNGQNCLCLIVTGGVPFEIPINRDLVISLPRACRTSGVPIECKATASTVPTPGTPSPGTYAGLSPPSPTAPFIPLPFTPPSSIPGGEELVPTLTPPGMRPTLTPSAAHESYRRTLSFTSLLVTLLGVIIYADQVQLNDLIYT